MSHIVDTVSLGAIVQVRDRLLDQQAKGRKVLRLESGDPSFDIPAHVREAMEKALRDGQTHYTASTGIPPLREAIFRKVTLENGLSVSGADNIVVTNGGMHGLYVLFRAMLEAGDEVILPDPMWTEIAENIRLGGGTPVPVRLRPESGYQYDPAEIESAITPRTRFKLSSILPTSVVVTVLLPLRNARCALFRRDANRIHPDSMPCKSRQPRSIRLPPAPDRVCWQPTDLDTRCHLPGRA